MVFGQTNFSFSKELGIEELEIFNFLLYSMIEKPIDIFLYVT